MNARLYDPQVGRFLSPDNYSGSPENPQSYNRYSYVLNNPLKYTDPSGNTVYGIFGNGGQTEAAFARMSLSAYWFSLTPYDATSQNADGTNVDMAALIFGPNYNSYGSGGGNSIKYMAKSEKKKSPPSKKELNAARVYNSKQGKNNDKVLKEKAAVAFGFFLNQFKANFDFTTIIEEKWGLDDDGLLVSPDGKRGIAAYSIPTTEFSSDEPIYKNTIHVSPFILNSSSGLFNAIIGHELLHGYHRLTLKENFDPFYSDAAAYDYSIQTMKDFGVYGTEFGISFASFAINKGYNFGPVFSTFDHPYSYIYFHYPSQYKWPLELWKGK